MMRAHAAAYDVLHREQPEANVGLAVNYVVFEPARDNILDRQLASAYDTLFNRATLSYLQGTPLPLPFAMMAAPVPECAGKIDFVGLNVYNRLHVRAPLGEKFGPGGLHVPAMCHREIVASPLLMVRRIPRWSRPPSKPTPRSVAHVRHGKRCP